MKMNLNRRILRLAATAAAALFAATVALAQSHTHEQMPSQMQGKQQTIKVGKKGEINLPQDAMVGDLMLKAGAYLVQHRVEGNDHFVHFTKMSEATPNSYSVYPKTHEGESKCFIVPLPNKASQTVVVLEKQDDGTYRLKRIEIAGENVAHLL